MTRRVICYIGGLILRIFFRRIEVVGRERVPREGGVIFIVNHPNALVDPLFMLCLAPRQVSFLAKSTLLRMPVVGRLARALDTLPIYRQQDTGENTARNAETFRLCRALLKRGGAIAICPEGVSHNEPRLRPLKTGAARIALGAAAQSCDDEKLEIKIVPVGLDYTAKTVFRSSALLHFGTPVTVPAIAMGADGEPPRAAVSMLSSEIEKALRDLVINAECERTLETITSAERIWSSEEETVLRTDTDAANLHRQLGLRQRFIEGYAFHRRTSETETPHAASYSVVLDELELQVKRYDRILRAARVDPRDLTTVQHAPGALLRRVALQVLLILMLLPIAFFGAIVHYPAYRLTGSCANRFARGSDDMVATIKMLAALLLFPLTWLLIALACWQYMSFSIAILALTLLPLSGYVAMRFLEIEERLSEQLRVLYVSHLRPSLFAELVAERRRIRKRIAELAAQMETAA